MKTAEALYQQYGRKHPPLVDVARDYLGITSAQEVGKRALRNELGGIKGFKMGGKKSPWLCDIEQVAEVLDRLAKG